MPNRKYLSQLVCPRPSHYDLIWRRLTWSQAQYNMQHIISGVIIVGDQIFVRVQQVVVLKSAFIQTRQTFTSKFWKHYDGLSSQRNVIIVVTISDLKLRRFMTILLRIQKTIRSKRNILVVSFTWTKYICVVNKFEIYLLLRVTAKILTTLVKKNIYLCVYEENFDFYSWNSTRTATTAAAAAAESAVVRRRRKIASTSLILDVAQNIVSEFVCNPDDWQTFTAYIPMKKY